MNLGTKSTDPQHCSECRGCLRGTSFRQASGNKTFFMLNSAEHRFILLINVKIPRHFNIYKHDKYNTCET